MKPWSKAELDRVVALREDVRLQWKVIARQLPGRTVLQCTSAYHNLKVKLRRAEERSRRDGLAAIAAIAVKPAPRAAGPAIVPRRAYSTAILVAAAELRSRIEARGITAGFFGDPPAGCSALDKQRAGIVEAAAPDRRKAQEAPPVTLPREPMRW
jgi:hypothetical protein